MSRLFQRRRLAGLAALVGLGVLAAGCSGGGGGSAAPAGLEKTNLVVAAVPAMDSAGLYIAQQRGLFAAEGLHVTILPATSGATAIASQLKGRFDVTAGNYVSYIRANAYNPKEDQFRVLAAGSIMEAANQEIMVPSNSKITNVSQLAGKKIAVNVNNGIGTLLVSSVLTDNAVAVPTPNEFVPVPFEDMASALTSGKVAAAWMSEPFVTEAEEKIGAVPLADSNQGHSENLPISGYMVTSSWLKANPNTAAAFRRAIIKAQDIATVDPGAIEQGMVKFAGTTQSAAAIAAAPQFPTQQNTVLLQRLSNLLLDFAMLPANYNVAQMIAK